MMTGCRLPSGDFSDPLLITLMKARRPERFKDRAVIEHDLSDGVADRPQAARLRMLGQLAPPTIIDPTPEPDRQ